MAVNLQGSGQYFQLASPLITGTPLTISGWGNPDNITAADAFVSLSTQTTNHWRQLNFQGNVGGDPIRFNAKDTVTSAADTSSGYSAGVWQNLAAVDAAINDRAAFLDGGSKGTASASRTIDAATILTIGGFDNGSVLNVLAGDVAEIALWNVALTDDEVAILGLGFSPLFVRPQSLVYYWPLHDENDLTDRISGATLTKTGSPTKADHPRIIYPSAPIIGIPAAAVVAGIAPHMMYYKKMRAA